MNDEILMEIKEFLDDRFAIDPAIVMRDSDIEKDLKITGADAVDCIIAFGKKFNVDVSTFSARDYFNSEGMNMLVPDCRPNKKRLKISDLESAVIAGKLC